MLPARNRLRKRRDFERVFNSKSSFSGRFFRLIYSKSDLSFSRLGVVVSSKVSKKAVIRNKIRRRVYVFIKPYIKIINPPLDMAMIISKTAVEADIKEFKDDVVRVLEKII